MSNQELFDASESGNLDLVKQILATKKIDINARHI